MISRIASVFTRSNAINHHFCPFRAESHSAYPFHGSVHKEAITIKSAKFCAINCSGVMCPLYAISWAAAIVVP